MLDLEGFTALLDAPTRRDPDARIGHLTLAEPAALLDPFDVGFELDADAQPGDLGAGEFGTP